MRQCERTNQPKLMALRDQTKHAQDVHVLQQVRWCLCAEGTERRCHGGGYDEEDHQHDSIRQAVTVLS